MGTVTIDPQVITKAKQFRAELSRRVMIADGAMGTMLYAKGVFINRSFDELNVTAPQMVKEQLSPRLVARWPASSPQREDEARQSQ